jgi:hypothetical protein
MDIFTNLSFLIILFLWLLSFILILNSPWLGVLVLLILQIPLIQASEGVNYFEIAFLVMFITTMLAWLAKHHRKSRLIVYKQFVWPMLLFFSFCFASILVAYYQNIGIVDWGRSWYRFSIMLIFIPIATEYNTSYRRNTLVFFFLIISTVIVCIEIFQITQRGSFFIRNFEDDYRTSFGNTWYLWGLIVASSLFLGVKTKPIKFGLLMIILLDLWRLIIGFRRQPLILFFLALALIFLFVLRDKGKKNAVAIIWFMLIFAILALVFGSEIVYELLPGYSQRFTAISLSHGFQSRMGVNAIAFKDFLESPIWGKGFGYETEYQIQVDGRLGTIFHVHSLYVYLLVHGGLIAFFSIILLFWRSILFAWKINYNTIRSHYDIFMGIGFATTLIIIPIFGIFSVKITRIEAWFVFAIALGLLVNINGRSRK